MIRQITIFRYEGAQAQSLAACVRWVAGCVSSLPYLGAEDLIGAYFDGEWAFYRLLVGKLDAAVIEITEEEGRRFKALLSHLLSGKGMSFSSDAGKLAAPLLHDLANLQALQMRAVG